MKFYYQIHFNEISDILMRAAMGVAAVCGNKLATSDMVYALSGFKRQDAYEPYYIAIREQGTENGDKQSCIERCKVLGYPIVIAKIEKDCYWDYNMKIMFTQNWMSGNSNYMEQEFDLL